MRKFDDKRFMLAAIKAAEHSMAGDEVPVGAVVVYNNKIIATGRNATISRCDPTAHAEVQALRAAARMLGNYRLLGCSLFVTLEPCLMCCGAMIHARIERLVFGAREPKSGAVISQLRALDLPSNNHRIDWHEGLLCSKSSDLLTSFFLSKR